MTVCPDVKKTKQRTEANPAWPNPVILEGGPENFPRDFVWGVSHCSVLHTSQFFSFSSRRLLKCRADATPQTGGRTSQVTQTSPRPAPTRDMQGQLDEALFSWKTSVTECVMLSLSMLQIISWPGEEGNLILLCFYVSSSQKSEEGKKHVWRKCL